MATIIPIDCCKYGLVFFCNGKEIEFSPANATCAYVRIEKMNEYEKFKMLKNIFFEFYDYFGRSNAFKTNFRKPFAYEVSSDYFIFLYNLKSQGK